jgi:hypothetical protein
MRAAFTRILGAAAAALALAGGAAAAVATAATGSRSPTPSTATTPTGTTQAPSSGGTQSGDAASDRAALIAYQAYLQALVKGVPAGAKQDAMLTATVKRRCAGVLGPLSALPSAQLNSLALSDLGEEIGGDLAIEFLSEAQGPFQQLSATLTPLSWAEPAPQAAIHALLSAESAILALSPTTLCADARALAAHPRKVPAATLAFLATYLADSAALKQQLTEFLTVLSKYATAKDNDVINAVNQLVARFGAAQDQAEHVDADAILVSLGLSPS